MGWNNLAVNAVQFIDRERGWAAGDFGLLLYTSDSGTTWEDRSDWGAGLFRNIWDISVIDSSRIWVVGERTLAHTTDGGLTWQRDTTTFGTGLYILKQVFFVDTTHGWTLMDFPGDLYKTTDGGQSWVPGNGNISVGIGWVYFLNPDSGWAYASDGMYRTSDGGNYWEKIFDTPVGEFMFVDESVGWGGGAINIYMTTEGGDVWELLTQNVTSVSTSLQAVDFVDSQTGWTVGSGGIILATTSGGENWIYQPNGANSRLTDVMFLNEEIGWAVGFNETILGTHDGGNNWQLLQQSSGREPHRAIFFVDSLTGWVVGGDIGDPGWIRKSTDGGANWVEQTPAVIPRMFDVYFQNQNTGWVVGDGGTILHTVNGGIDWQQQISGVTASLGRVEFTTPLEGWILNGDGILLHTVDKGQNWEVVTVDSPLYGLHDMSFADQHHAWVVGIGDIYYTNDGGNTWIKQQSGTTRGLNSVDFVDSTKGWIVGSRGVILHTSTGGVTGISNEPKPDLLPFAFRLYPNYPNPFNGTTSIRFKLSEDSHIDLSIYNILGQKVKTLFNGRRIAGEHTVRWDGTAANGVQAASGIYFYRLAVDGMIKTPKMLKLD